jgi:hypothetical protein
VGSKLRTVLAPELTSPVVELADPDGGSLPLFRKRILPLGPIEYPLPDGTTRTVRFDRAYHQRLIDSFHAGAYDQVPLQLADAENRHNMLLERQAGVVVDVGQEQPGEDPGLYATVRPLGKKGAKLLRRNPDIGVSAQIKENLQTVHGDRYPAAIRHILATLDPRVRKLGPWQAISLSDDDDTGKVIDLTGATDHRKKAHRMATKSKGKAKKGKGGMDLSDPRPYEGELDLSDDAALEAALTAAADDLDTGGPYSTGFELANQDGGGDAAGTLSLAAEVEAQRDELRVVQGNLARAEWERQRADYSVAGVPKHMLDLAAPLLGSVGETALELSDADGDVDVDPRAIVKGLLDAARGYVDLADAAGIGAFPADRDDDPDDPNSPSNQALLGAWSNTSGPAR